jgi:uncharacterized protein YeaO (DUF488 family)
VPGDIRDTYVAALQHDLVDVGDATRVGVVRRPTGWFSGAVDENQRALAPPESLLEETKNRQEDFEMQGICSEEAHNQAWEATDFAERYREHLASDADAQDAVDTLVDRVRDGESIALVCFENTDQKRCHRTILKGVLGSRLDESDPNA